MSAMALRHGLETEMDRKALIFSGLLHASVVAVAIFGVPALWMKPPDPAEPVVIVELAPIREISNAPPPAPKTVEAKPEPPKEQPKQQPARVEAPPPPPPPQAEPEPSPTPLPKAKPEVPKPEPAPVQAALDVPKPRTKPEPPKVQQPTPPQEKSKADFDPTRIAALINKVQKPTAQTTPPTPAKTTATEAPAVKAQGPSNPNLPVSQSDKDFIRAQVERHWAFDIGAKNANDLVIRISVSFNSDGTLKKQPEVVDQARMFLPGQEAYRSAAEAARRAVLKAVPIKLPPGDPDRWAQEIVLVFNPRDMLGG